VAAESRSRFESGYRSMDPFATLGFERRYNLDKALLDRRYRELQQALHPDKHVSAPASERALTLSKAIEVNEAYRVLRDDQKRGEALLAGMGRAVSEQQADPELLTEMMELREALSDAREADDQAQVSLLAADVTEKASATSRQLSEVFTRLESKSASETKELSDAQTLLARLRYYRRFQDEVAQFEDQALT
jgi:molecular chaperone HscB